MPGTGGRYRTILLEEMRFRAIEAHQAGQGVGEIAKAAGCTLGQCIALAYKMAA